MARTAPGDDRTAYSQRVARVGDAHLVEVRQDQIVGAAKKLFSRNGFSKTTISDIAGAAGISVGLVYEYVRTKEDILVLMLERNFDHYRAGLAAALAEGDNGLERLMNGVYYYVTEVDQDRQGVLVWYREAGHLTAAGRELMKSGERSHVQVFADAIEDAQRQGLVKDDIDSWSAAGLIELCCQGRALKSYAFGGSSSDFATTILSTLLSGLATDDGHSAVKRYKSRAGRRR